MVMIQEQFYNTGKQLPTAKQNKMNCIWHCLHGTELFEKLLSQD